MSDLNNRVGALESRGTYRIVTYTGTSNKWEIPDDLLDYDFCILTFRCYNELKSIDGKSFMAAERGNMEFSKSGNYIVPTKGIFSVEKILFYK